MILTNNERYRIMVLTDMIIGVLYEKGREDKRANCGNDSKLQ
jgi:hypothetical protein